MSDQIKSPVTPKQLVKLLKATLAGGRVPMIHGSPGIGKSDIVRAVAEEYNLKVIDLRLPQIDPTELNGFPTITKDGKASYIPMDIFPLENDEIPEGYSGWLIFFDELPTAMPAIQAAAYKIILDRLVGQKPLHESVAMVAAGNLRTDGAVANNMSTALQSRMVHYLLQPNNQDWIDWALANGIDSRIISFVDYKKDALNSFEKNHGDFTFACGRTFHALSDQISQITDSLREYRPLIYGTIGAKYGVEFESFCGVYQQLPKYDDIVAKPQTCNMPTQAGHLYALAGYLAEHTQPKDMNAIDVYLRRMSEDFQVLTMKYIIRKNKSLISSPVVGKWIDDNENLFVV